MKKDIIIPYRTKDKCCNNHKNPRPLYLEWTLDAEKRYEKGEEQKQCPVCLKWFWKDEL